MAVKASGRPSEMEVERALRLAVERVDAELDRIAAHVAEVLHREMPELHGDPQSRKETRRAGLATLRMFQEALRRGEPPEAVALPSESMASVRAMARSGPSVAPLLRMYQLAHGASFDAWDEQLAAADLPRDVVIAASRRAHQLGFVWIDSLSEQATKEFERERERWARTPEARRAETTRAILSGEATDVEAVSRTLGYELRRHHVGLVLWTRDDEATAMPKLERAAGEVAEELGCSRPLAVPAASAYLWAWSGTESAPAEEALDTLASRFRRDRISVGIGEPGHGLAGFRASHRDALDAARVLMLSERSPGSVARYRTVQLGALMLGDQERTSRFVLEELGPLSVDDDENARLRATLKVYLEENASRVAVSRRLGIHANTVANRVRACQELLGRDLRTRQVELQVALTLAETLGAAVLRETSG